MTRSNMTGSAKRLQRCTITAIGMLAGLVLCPAHPVHGEDAAATSPLYVVASPVELVSGYQVVGRHVGRVVGRRTSELGFDAAGLLEAVLVEDGDHVREGEVLARLDTTRLDARRRRLEADLAVAQARYEETGAKLDLAKATAERQRDLLKSNSVSRQSYDEARFEALALTAGLKANDAAIEQAKAAIASLDADLAMSRILAPFDGTVVDTLVDEGTALTSSTPVLRLLDDREMEVRIGLPPDVAGTVSVGERYDITIGDNLYPAVLRAVLEELDPVTRTIRAVLVVDKQPHGQWPSSGQLASLDITKRIRQDGYWMPLGALVGGRRGLWNAMALERVDPQGDAPLYRIIRREVEVLQTETDRVFVRGAIVDGDLIMTDGVHLVVPGQIVRLSEPAG